MTTLSDLQADVDATYAEMMRLMETEPNSDAARTAYANYHAAKDLLQAELEKKEGKNAN